MDFTESLAISAAWSFMRIVRDFSDSCTSEALVQVTSVIVPIMEYTFASEKSGAACGVAAAGVAVDSDLGAAALSAGGGGGGEVTLMDSGFTFAIAGG